MQRVTEYPCLRYEKITEYDSFITHQHQQRNLQKMQMMGQEAYWAEQRGKIKLLNLLLEQYNDGRRKTFFLVAVNLLELSDLRTVVQRLEQECTNNSAAKRRLLMRLRCCRL